MRDLSQQLQALLHDIKIDTDVSFDTLYSLSEELGQKLKRKEWMITSAESCTGGGVASILTEVAGSSAWVERGYVTYSNQAKNELLGVKQHTLETYGAVSEQTAQEMAQGVVVHSQSQMGLSITGIAGPDGGTKEKPVGTVWFAWYDCSGKLFSYRGLFAGNRRQVRRQAIATALIGSLLLVDQ